MIVTDKKAPQSCGAFFNQFTTIGTVACRNVYGMVFLDTMDRRDLDNIHIRHNMVGMGDGAKAATAVHIPVDNAL